MILVTLGTQDKQFYRLLETIDKLLENKIIKDKVIVQAGISSDFKSNNMEIFDLIPMDEFDKLIAECDILITHGGVGSIITGLKNNKKVIAVARLKRYHEHVNDHQLQIIDNFAKAGHIIGLDEFDNLGDIIKNINKFKPKKYKSNNKKFNLLLQDVINSFIN